MKDLTNFLTLLSKAKKTKVFFHLCYLTIATSSFFFFLYSTRLISMYKTWQDLSLQVFKFSLAQTAQIVFFAHLKQITKSSQYIYLSLLTLLIITKYIYLSQLILKTHLGYLTHQEATYQQIGGCLLVIFYS